MSYNLSRTRSFNLCSSFSLHLLTSGVGTNSRSNLGVSYVSFPGSSDVPNRGEDGKF
jgi:hypothetical protein